MVGQIGETLTTPPLSFEHLVAVIGQTHAELAAQASRAVNVSITLRNWLIGFHIAEYEQQGTDRARYGDKLIERLSERLNQAGVSRSEARELRRYRLFYMTYPQIRETLSPELARTLPQTASHIREALAPTIGVAASEVLTKLSFSHIIDLLQCDDATKRAFYELECIRGNWSVRELRRQIASLYYERSGLSSESHLEDQLLDKLHDFLLELGHGFCFEARQKRILIGDSHYFVDLVFYHRILKCHVLVELKLAAFSHENIGQLNTYVSWYRKNMMTEGDNPPVGILLCTQKDHALMEYALAGLDNGLFVSKYMLELPKKEQMQGFIEEQLAAGLLDEKDRHSCREDEP